MLVLFSTNNLPGSLAIRAFTWSEFSHCDIVLSWQGEGKLLGAVPFKGVVEYPLTKRLKRSKVWALASIPARDSEVFEFAQAQLGKRYDWLGVLGIGLRNRNWEQDNAWFCSELIAAAAAAGGCQLLSPLIKYGRITPQDLIQSPLLRWESAHPDAEHLLES